MTEFKNCTNSEKQQLVFEYFKQKYLFNPTLNNFAEHIQVMTNYIFTYDENKEDDYIKSLTTFKDSLTVKYSLDFSDELFYYFYYITKGNNMIQKYPYMKKVSEILLSFFKIDTIENRLEFPDTIITLDKPINKNGFTMMEESKFTSTYDNKKETEKYEKEKKEFQEKYPNPYGHIEEYRYWYDKPTFPFKSICDILRYNFFELLLDDKNTNIGMYEYIDDVNAIIPHRSYFIKNYPTCDDEDDDLDFENFENFIIHNENKISFTAGGDWQEPMSVSIKVNKNNEIEAFNICNNDDTNDDYDDKSDNIFKLFGLNKKDYNFDSSDESEFEKFYKDCVKNKNYKLK